MTAPKLTSRRRPDGPPPRDYKRPGFTYGDKVEHNTELALAMLLDAVLYASPKMVTPTMRMQTASYTAAETLVPGHGFSGPDAAKRALDRWVRAREKANA